MRFFYYLFIVKRRLTFLILALAAAAAAWGIQEGVERAMISKDAAPPERIQSALELGVVTDWDMCTQFHPDTANQGGRFISMLAAQQSVTNGDLDKFNDLIARCARVTVPLAGERAALARKVAGLPRI